MEKHREALEFLDAVYHLVSNKGMCNYTARAKNDLKELVDRDEPALLVQVWKEGEGEPYLCSSCFSAVPHMFLGAWHFCPICGKRMGTP